MAGSNQSVNLQGMLGDIANVVGDMGKAYDFIPNTIREIARPEVDMNDPNKMKAYGIWLSRNGNEAAGAQMMQAAATRQQELKSLEGERKIMELSAGWSEMLPSQRANAEKAIAAIGQQYEVSPLKVQAQLEANRQAERKLDAADTDIANRMRLGLQQDSTNRYGIDTRADVDIRGQDTQLEIADIDANTRLAIAGMQDQTERRGQDIQWRLGKGDQDIRWAGLTEEKRANIAREGIANSQIEYDYAALEEGARQFDEDLSFRNLQLEQEAWMDSRTVAQWAEQNDIAWKGLRLEERQVNIAQALADNEINETEFSQIMRSNADRRADELLPHEIGLLQAQVDKLKADARFTDINWERVEYELGLSKKLESSVIEAAKLDNRLTKATIARTKEEADLIEAQIETERERPDYIEAQVDAMNARTELEQDQFQWRQKVEQTAMELADINALSEREVNTAQAFNLTSLANSRIFADNLTMSGLLADQVSQAERDAYSYAYDPTNPSSVAGARQAFLAQHPGEGKVFDEVATTRAAQARILLETNAFAQGMKEGRRVTDQELRAARMPENLIEQISVLQPADRAAQINQWVNREIEGPRSGVPTTDLIEIYKGVADDMVSEAFGFNVWFGLDRDGVNEANLKSEVAAAMASAAAAGQSDGQRYAAGLAVMRNAVKKSGANDAVSALGRLELKYRD